MDEEERNQGRSPICTIKENREISGILLWKLHIYDPLISVKCITLVLVVAILGEGKYYIFIRGMSLGSPAHLSQLEFLTSLLVFFPARVVIVREREMEKRGEAEKEVGQGSGSVPATMGRGSSAWAPSPEGEGMKVSRRPRGDGSLLIIDMEAARRAISGSLVIGRLLSPFKVHPQILVGLEATR